MPICHPHNLNRDLAQSKQFGIRVSLPVDDTFNRLLGEDWEQFHWYETEEKRDTALADMASVHLYSRRGDRPRVVYTAVDRSMKSDSG